MEYRVFGRTGLRVSQVGLGCGDVGGLIVRGEPALRTRAVALALSLGINYFDTAPLYGQGVSETNLGLALKENKADVFVGTKMGLTPEDKKDIKNGVIRSLERSLKRLDMESVDLIQLHNRLTSEPEVPNLTGPTWTRKRSWSRWWLALKSYGPRGKSGTTASLVWGKRKRCKQL